MDCYVWPGGCDGDGYGVLWFEGRSYKVHRVAFWMVHGFWPTVCRHTCDNPPCFNPEHLRDGSHADNAQDRESRGRGRTGSGTTCAKGHEYTAKNTRVRIRNGREQRLCRTCAAERERRYRNDKQLG